MNLVFIHLPRTGGTSIGIYLQGCGVPVRNLVHNSARGTCSEGCCWLKEKPILPLPQDSFFFGFVRNPWDWYVSRYFYFKRQETPERGVSKLCELGVHFKPQVSFRDHLLSHKENPWFWMTYRYQHLFCDETGKLLLHYVGKTENIGDGIDTVFALHGLKPKQTYEEWDKTHSGSRNRSEHKHYSSYYDDELMSLVTEKDKMLIETYGYEYEAV